jgi:hypothetical protein
MGFSGSDAARFQAYQTRARMGAQLWGRLLISALIVWLALTFYMVWRHTGLAFPQLDHAYFWPWVLCGMLSHAPGFRTLTLPLNGAWYPVGPLTDWINGPQMYYASFPRWFCYYGIRTALVPVGLGLAAIAWRSRHRLDATHIRGLQLLTPREHNRQLNGGIIRTMFDQHTGIQIGTSIIPREKECENFLITGSPGSGKSTKIRNMLHQVRDRPQTAIVLDVDSEFIQEFYDEGRGDVVLNPLDARCPFWTPWLEFREESFTMDTEAMAASLVRGDTRNKTEEFFRDSARTLIEAIFEKATDRQHPGSIADFLALPRPEMHKKLIGTRAYPLVDEHAAEQGNRHHFGRRERNQGLLPPTPQRTNHTSVERPTVGREARGLDISTLD